MVTGEKLKTKGNTLFILECQFNSYLFFFPQDLQEENESLKAHVQEVAQHNLKEVSYKCYQHIT